MAHIIFLHGASSSGKTTLARKLQAVLDRPFWHISIDHLRDSGVLPMRRFDSGEFRWADARGSVFHGFHASLQAYVDAGNNLILEHILDTPGWLEDLRMRFKGHDVLFIGIHCPLDVLEQREIERGDRPRGMAKADFEAIHNGLCYDLTVNATDSLEDNVTRIIGTFLSERRHSSFPPDFQQHV